MKRREHHRGVGRVKEQIRSGVALRGQQRLKDVHALRMPGRQRDSIWRGCSLEAGYRAGCMVTGGCGNCQQSGTLWPLLVLPLAVSSESQRSRLPCGVGHRGQHHWGSFPEEEHNGLAVVRGAKEQTTETSLPGEGWVRAGGG